MEDLKKIQEFFSKPLEESKKLGLDDTITPDMWDQSKIEAGRSGKYTISYPDWFKKDHKIINYNSVMGMIFFDHPAKPKRSINWVNSFLKDEFKVDLSDQPEGRLQVREKALKEGKQLDIEDFAKVVQAVTQTGHPVTVLLTPKFNEIEVLTGMNAPDDMIRDLSIAVDSLGYGRNDIIIAGDSSNLSRREYSDIRRVNGGHRDYFEESLNEAEYTDYSNKELAAYCKNNPTDKKAAKELHKRSQALKGLTRTDVNEGAVEIMDAFNDVMDLVKKHSRNLNDDDSYAFALKLKAWFNKNILDEAKVEVDDETEFKLDLKHLLDKHVVEATKEEETEFHAKLDKLVHDTFGKRKGELEESSTSEERRIAKRAIRSIAKYRGVSEDEARNDLIRAANELGDLKENMLSLDDQAKAYYLEKLKKGEIDTLPEDPKAAFLNQMTKDQMDHDAETLRRERGLEETAAYIAETIKLGQQLNEELCDKGKRYIKARQAAGEKSSAYLSGRAVRVCKGQIEWPKKGKKKK